MTDPILLKYALRNTPRYTSYPTAPHFSDAVGPNTYTDWLDTVDSQARGSLYLHVPYCAEMCWYCGCQTRATKRTEPVARYADTLMREIDMVADRLPQTLTIDHIHWGGGTPTLLAAEDLQRLMVRIGECFDISDKAEIAIEIDPRTLTGAMTETLNEAGFNRVSLGIQTFDDKVQKAINRVQSFETTKRCVDQLRAAGLTAINVDLLYGLPHQDEASCKETVRAVKALNPDRLSVFGYAHVPHMRTHQKMIRDEDLPGPEARIAHAQAIADEMVEQGYVPVGIDHYARADDALAKQQAGGQLKRNFQGYTTDRADVLLGLGASSIGRLPQGYVQNAASTAQWQRSIEAGELAIVRGYALDADDLLRAEIIERLMCDLHVDKVQIARQFGQFPDYDLQDLLADSVVEDDADTIRVSEPYRMLARNVAAQFDSRLAGSTATHSRSI